MIFSVDQVGIGRRRSNSLKFLLLLQLKRVILHLREIIVRLALYLSVKTDTLSACPGPPPPVCQKHLFRPSIRPTIQFVVWQAVLQHFKYLGDIRTTRLECVV